MPIKTVHYAEVCIRTIHLKCFKLKNIFIYIIRVFIIFVHEYDKIFMRTIHLKLENKAISSPISNNFMVSTFVLNIIF